MKKQTVELIDVLHAELRAAGMCFGVDRADDMAQSVLRRVVKRLGGRRVYVRTTVRSRAEIERAVRRDFNGANLADVARKHSISVRSVYRMLSGEHPADPSSGSNKPLCI